MDDQINEIVYFLERDLWSNKLIIFFYWRNYALIRLKARTLFHYQQHFLSNVQ